MLKLFGACLILLSTTMMGLKWAQRFVNRPREIRLFRTALQRLESEISYGATPLPSALTSIARQTPSPVGDCLGEVARQLNNPHQLSLMECWRQGLLAHWSKTSLLSAEKEIILQFGHTLGSSDREDQVKHIQLVLAHLAAEEENAILEQQKNEKLCRSLGLLAGALAVILMY
jgi:stage III sporulation protein AB